MPEDARLRHQLLVLRGPGSGRNSIRIENDWSGVMVNIWELEVSQAHAHSGNQKFAKVEGMAVDVVAEGETSAGPQSAA